MGLWTRQCDSHEVLGPTRHSDKDVQYIAVRYTKRIAESGVVALLGSTSDSCPPSLPLAAVSAPQLSKKDSQVRLLHHRCQTR